MYNRSIWWKSSLAFEGIGEIDNGVKQNEMAEYYSILEVTRFISDRHDEHSSQAAGRWNNSLIRDAEIGTGKGTRICKSEKRPEDLSK